MYLIPRLPIFLWEREPGTRLVAVCVCCVCVRVRTCECVCVREREGV